MTARRHRAFWPCLVLAAVLVAGGAGLAAWQVAKAGLAERVDRALVLTARTLEAEIERYSYLPLVALEDPRIRAAVTYPQSAERIATANRALEVAARQSGADELYLLDETGTALASSNWRDDTSFVGENYAFRPYFTDAMAGGSGRSLRRRRDDRRTGVFHGHPGHGRRAPGGGRGQDRPAPAARDMGRRGGDADRRGRLWRHHPVGPAALGLPPACLSGRDGKGRHRRASGLCGDPGGRPRAAAERGGAGGDDDGRRRPPAEAAGAARRRLGAAGQRVAGAGAAAGLGARRRRC
ncbi:cache domain-containing protein [Ponticoccus litoralis]|uniref:Uncharacterized protein n=1 Tax=Ponticoccus litoralis TaxID=422297 RepID=A0AAW9S6T2_9RHOB